MGRTYDQLRRAEEKIHRRSNQEWRMEDMDSFLCKLGLGEDQISKKNQNEVQLSLILLNRYIEKPERLNELSSSNSEFPIIGSGESIMQLLRERKMLALLRYDKLMNKEKVEKIRYLAGKINDKDLRATIEGYLSQLEIKDQFIRKEYRKLANIGNIKR